MCCNSVIACDCYSDAPYTFASNYLSNYNSNDVFFVKGVKLKTEYYGIQLKVIEDMKGNIQEENITVWGDNGNSCRIDFITSYNDNDTLCMLIRKISLPDWENIETVEDYAIIACAYSVMQFSNGYITGRINTAYEDNSMLLSDFLSQYTNLTNPNLDKDIYLYPNPVGYQLDIKLGRHILLPLQVRICNASGQFVQMLSYRESEFAINTSSLSVGLYFIQITDGNKNKLLTRKFVKL
jgi:hypothetical protein